MNCDPETCPLAQKRRDDFIQELDDIYGNKPCSGFVHNHSCDADCLKYRCMNYGGQIQNYCGDKRIDKRAFKFIKLVGCYSYARKNGDNK